MNWTTQRLQQLLQLILITCCMFLINPQKWMKCGCDEHLCLKPPVGSEIWSLNHPPKTWGKKNWHPCSEGHLGVQNGWDMDPQNDCMFSITSPKLTSHLKTIRTWKWCFPIGISKLPEVYFFRCYLVSFRECNRFFHGWMRWIGWTYGCFQKIGVPQIGWFIMKNPIKMGWFGGKTHYFRKHPYFVPNNPSTGRHQYVCFQPQRRGRIGASRGGRSRCQKGRRRGGRAIFGCLKRVAVWKGNELEKSWKQGSMVSMVMNLL